MEQNGVAIKNRNSLEIFSVFPTYGKHSIGGADYGYLVVTNELRVLYFYADYSGGYTSVEYSDVTDNFERELYRSWYKLSTRFFVPAPT